jgi:hypothetical protein
MKVVIFCKNNSSFFVTGLSRDAVRGLKPDTRTPLYFVNYALNEMKMLVGSTAVWGGRLDPKRSDLLFR